jgi:hypothetical protein
VSNPHCAIEPLLHPEGDRVLVYGQPICADCGLTLQAIGPDRWRHAGPVRPRLRPRRSKWLTPSIQELLSCESYERFAKRYPWAVRTPALAITRSQWCEGITRLKDYKAARDALARRKSLEAGENPYREILALLAAPGAEVQDVAEAAAIAQQPSNWGLPYGLYQMLGMRERRQELVQLCAWAIPNDAALATLSRYAPLLDCGAGTGYWAALLRAGGVDVAACDLHPPHAASRNAFHRMKRAAWTAIEPLSAVAAVRRYRGHTLFLCWPPYQDDAASYEALRAYRGDVFIHVGERHEGATGSARFHRELRLNWTLELALDLPRWPRLRDQLMVYRRNPQRRALRERDRCYECRRFMPTGAIGRCDACFGRRPPALAVRDGRHRAEYTPEMLTAMPAALRKALELSPNRVR